MQPRGRIQALAIPTQQHPTAKEWRRLCIRGGDTPAGAVIPSACISCVNVSLAWCREHARAPVEGEQRRLRVEPPVGGAALELLVEQLADPGAVRDQAALAELAALDDQQLAFAVEIAEAQRACLTAAQSQPVAEREDRAIRRAALRGVRAIRQRAGRVEQPACLAGVEDERDPCRGHPPPARAQRRALQQFVRDRPVEQAADNAEQMIEAARRRARPRREEPIQNGWRELLEPLDPVLGAEAHKQPQLGFLADVLARDRPLVLQEGVDGVLDGHRASTSSPSPSAISRSDSTATFR